jgi:hypothetical protein
MFSPPWSIDLLFKRGNTTDVISGAGTAYPLRGSRVHKRSRDLCHIPFNNFQKCYDTIKKGLNMPKGSRSPKSKTDRLFNGQK